MPISYHCPRCRAGNLKLLKAGYRGVELVAKASSLQEGDRILCSDCNWLGPADRLIKKTRRLGLKTYFEWDLRDYSNVLDENYHRVMELEPGTDTPYLEYLNLVHPEDRQSLVATLQRQFEKGGFGACHYRLAKPPHKNLYSETTIVLDSDGQPTRMKGSIQEIFKD